MDAKRIPNRARIHGYQPRRETFGNDGGRGTQATNAGAPRNEKEAPDRARSGNGRGGRASCVLAELGTKGGGERPGAHHEAGLRGECPGTQPQPLRREAGRGGARSSQDEVV
jgi:hypothetical protein